LAFNNKSAIKSINIGPHIIHIGSNAFNSCDISGTLVIPNNVITIGSYSFNNNVNLTDVSFGRGLTTISEFAFLGCPLVSLYIPNNVITIETTFQNYNSLKNVHIDISNIPTNFFLNCSNLSNLTFGSTVRIIGTNAFNGCDISGTLVIPNNVTTIRSYSFNNNPHLTEVIFGNNVSLMQEFAFLSCPLVSLNIPSSNITFETTFQNYLTLKNVTINTVNIPNNLFYFCSNLNTLTLGQNVLTIGFNAFDNCDISGTLVIPNNVTTINQYSFNNNSHITQVNYGSSLSSLHPLAFNGCTGISSLRVPSLNYLNTYPNLILSAIPCYVNISSVEYIFEKLIGNNIIYADGTVFDLNTNPASVSYVIKGCDPLNNYFFITAYDNSNTSVTNFSGENKLRLQIPFAPGSPLGIYKSTSLEGPLTFVDNAVVNLDGTYEFLTDHLTIFKTGAQGQSGGGGNPHIKPMFGNSYLLPHDENCYLLYDNQNKNERVVVTAKCWFLPENLKNKSLFRNDFMDKTTFFKYINIHYKSENLTIDMETLKPVKYTNMKDVNNIKLQFCENKTSIELSEFIEYKYALKDKYNLMKRMKYKIDFNGTTRLIKLGDKYEISLILDLNCADHPNEIKLIKANYNNSIGALVNEKYTKAINYLIPNE
jgi:hypothetical protein